MTRGLRRARGTPPELGIFEVTGSLDGIEPGGRVVKVLRVRRMGPGTVEGLDPLRRLPDLRKVELIDVTGVDLSALAPLGIESLTLQQVKGLDLAALGELPKLRYLQVLNFAECRVPERLRLASSLENLLVANDARSLRGAGQADDRSGSSGNGSRTSSGSCFPWAAWRCSRRSRSTSASCVT